MGTKADDQKAPFLDLPPEIRNNIYELVLTSNKRVTLSSVSYAPKRKNKIKNMNATPSLSPNLLLACKVIHQEATPILYGNNHLIIHDYPRHSSLTRMGASAQHLRHIGFLGCLDQVQVKKAFTLLKGAKGLQRLTIDHRCRDHFKSAESMARALGPLVRALHKRRAGTEGKGAMEVLEFSSIELDDNIRKLLWVGKYRAMKTDWEVFQKRTREVLEGTLG